eukprot:IDg11896t1
MCSSRSVKAELTKANGSLLLKFIEVAMCESHGLLSLRLEVLEGVGMRLISAQVVNGYLGDGLLLAIASCIDVCGLEELAQKSHTLGETNYTGGNPVNVVDVFTKLTGSARKLTVGESCDVFRVKVNALRVYNSTAPRDLREVEFRLEKRDDEMPRAADFEESSEYADQVGFIWCKQHKFVDLCFEVLF